MAFKKGHPHYTTKGDFKEGHIPWNKGTAILLDKICLFCGNSFKIRKGQILRGRGKYCNKKCKDESITIYSKTSLEKIICRFRQLDEYKKWQMDCLKRDYFKCQICGSKKKLEVHHKKLFRILVAEFLQEYNQFSPIEDKETLIRLAFNYKPFWDIDNGITLCKKCHLSTEIKMRIKEKGRIR